MKTPVTMTEQERNEKIGLATELVRSVIESIEAEDKSPSAYLKEAYEILLCAAPSAKVFRSREDNPAFASGNDAHAFLHDWLENWTH